jgi:LPXTG-motif cell wall-anchored protein
MIVRRALAGALIGLALAAAAPVTAADAAAPAYPPNGGASVAVSSSVIIVGNTVVLTGSGFAPNTAITITISQTGQGFASRAASRAAAEMPMGSLRPVGAAGPAVQRLAATAALLAVTTDGAGSFSTVITFSRVGVYAVTATGLASDDTTRSATGTVTVLPRGSGVGGTGPGTGTGSGPGTGTGVGGLPNTGASVRLPITLGAILVLAGAGLLTVVRRRKGRDVAA